VQLRARTPSLPADEVLSLTREEARRRFEGTPLMRAGRDGLVRSALAIATIAREKAEALVHDPAPGVREQARRRLYGEGNVSTAPLTAPASGDTR
jgi:hypothetical protein